MQQTALPIQSAIALALLLSTANAFLLMADTITLARMDSIVDPAHAAPRSGHAHYFAGSANVGTNSSTYDSLHSATCTSVDNTADKSGYWQAALYSHLPNGTFVPLPMQEIRIYYICNRGPNVTVPPQGLRILAGDKDAKTAQGNETKGTQFATFECQMGALFNGTNQKPQRGFMSNPCGDFLRASVQFPDCWDGKHIDSPDHISHMAYSTGEFHDCPPTHSIRIPTLILEWGYMSKEFDPRSLMISTGDTTGYGLHADYIMGWDTDVLARAIKDPTCMARQNADGQDQQCVALAPTHDQEAASTCKLASKVPQESVGIPTPIASLPGCNPLVAGGTVPCTAAQEANVSTMLTTPKYVSYGAIGPNLAIAP